MCPHLKWMAVVVEISNMKPRETASSLTDPHFGAGQRRVPRTPTTGACQMTWSGGEAEGSLLDISLEGAAVVEVYGPTPQAGDPICLAVEVDDIHFEVAAEVVSISEDTLAGVAVRMKFTEDAKSNADLRELVIESEEAFRHEQAQIFRHHL
ncbi:MAG: PilZ domain-containing protein [Dehalococcoidia bacterium]